MAQVVARLVRNEKVALAGSLDFLWKLGVRPFGVL